MEGALRLGLVTSGLAFLLLLASLAAGGGPLGFAWMRHPLWSYALLAAAIALLLILIPPRKTPQEAGRDEPSHAA